MSELFRRLRYLLNRRRFDRELANDLEFHREMAARAGGAPLGNALHLREEAREAWGWTWIDRFFQDLRYGARMLRRSPGFTATAVLMLALGIGVNVAAFGFFNLMVLRPLPVRDPQTLLRFNRSAPQNFSDNLPYPAVAFYREHSKALSAVLALSSGNLAMDGEAKQLRANFVTANFFSELGAVPRLGRLFDSSPDEASDAQPVVVLSQAFWERRFGADPSIAGKTIRLNGKVVTVAGVAPNDFSGLTMDAPDLWVPLNQMPYFVSGTQLLTDFSDSGISVRMWGRLRAGLTPPIAEEELASLAAELRPQHPNDMWEKENLPSVPGGYVTSLMGGRNEMVPVLALMGALGLLILAVACGNLGALLLARGVARDREIAIRVSIGAGRGRLLRQLFTESLLLAFLGALAGLALGYVVLRCLMALTEVPAWLNPAPDWRVVLFAVGIAFASAILFGLAPAWRIARQRHRAGFLRQVLIAAQIAASCFLLIVASLLLRALSHAVSTPPGFEYRQVISIDPGLHGYSASAARAYLDILQSRLRALPGVASVSMASNPPLGNRWSVIRTEIAGRAVAIHVNNVDPAFFETMKIPLLHGRSLVRGAPGEVVISQSLARVQWPGQDPLGKPFRVGTPAAGGGQTVVGISGNARLVSPEDSDAMELYQLAEGSVLPAMVLLVRASAPPEGLVRWIEATSKSIDPRLFPNVQLLKSAYRQKLHGSQYAALVVSLLAIVALFLACLGVVGLAAYAVSQRTKEIGIRMALGAQPRHVISAVLRQFPGPVLAGLLAGTVGAGALSQILRRVLYGVSNLDPAAYLAAIGILILTVALAALLPARQAFRVDPMRALRCD